MYPLMLVRYVSHLSKLSKVSLRFGVFPDPKWGGQFEAHSSTSVYKQIQTNKECFQTRYPTKSCWAGVLTEMHRKVWIQVDTSGMLQSGCFTYYHGPVSLSSPEKVTLFCFQTGGCGLKILRLHWWMALKKQDQFCAPKTGEANSSFLANHSQSFK